jgi:hypothetical protein
LKLDICSSSLYNGRVKGIVRQTRRWILTKYYGIGMGVGARFIALRG